MSKMDAFCPESGCATALLHIPGAQIEQVLASGASANHVAACRTG
jgi:hypothetical protein